MGSLVSVLASGVPVDGCFPVLRLRIRARVAADGRADRDGASKHARTDCNACADENALRKRLYSNGNAKDHVCADSDGSAGRNARGQYARTDARMGDTVSVSDGR